MPPGFAAVRDKWKGLCSYTANARGNSALCNIPTNTHSWRVPAQYRPGFMCGKVHKGVALPLRPVGLRLCKANTLQSGKRKTMPPPPPTHQTGTRTLNLAWLPCTLLL